MNCAHPPWNHSTVDFYDKMETPLLLWFITYKWNSLSLSFTHFPSFNLICSGQVAAHKQSTHQWLMMQRHTLSAYCVSVFGKAMNCQWITCCTHVTMLLWWDFFFFFFPKLGFCSVFHGGQWELMKSPWEVFDDVMAKGKCQCIHRTHKHILYTLSLSLTHTHTHTHTHSLTPELHRATSKQAHRNQKHTIYTFHYFVPDTPNSVVDQLEWEHSTHKGELTDLHHHRHKHHFISHLDSAAGRAAFCQKEAADGQTDGEEAGRHSDTANVQYDQRKTFCKP